MQFEPPQRNLHRQSQTQASVFLVPERRVSLLLRLNVTVVDSQRHCCCFSTSLLLRHNVTVVVSQHQCTSVTRFLLVPERRVSLLLRLNVTVVVSQHQCHTRFSGPSEIKHQADRPSLTCNEYTRTHSPQLLLHAIPFTHRYFLFLQGIAL